MIDMYNKLLEDILNENLIKPKEVAFGSNISKYDDGKIGYNPQLKAFFMVFAVEKGYVAVSISRTDGRIRYTYSENAYIGRMLHMPITSKRPSIIEALNYMPQILYCLILIIKAYHMRLPQLRLISLFVMQDRYHRFLLRSPSFKMLVQKYKFRDVQRQESKIDDTDVIIYDIIKE